MSRAVHGTRGPSISVVQRQPSEWAPLSLRARWWSEEREIHSRDGAECAARAGAHLGLVNQNRLYERDLGGPQVCPACGPQAEAVVEDLLPCGATRSVTVIGGQLPRIFEGGGAHAATGGPSAKWV